MKKTVIGISLLTFTHAFYQELEKGMLKEAEKGNDVLDITEFTI